VTTPEFSPDDAVLRMLSGANFGPNAHLTLPSGETLTSDEAQAFTAAFGDNGAVEPESGR